MTDSHNSPPRPRLQEEKYYPLTQAIARELRTIHPPLTAAEWRLWSLLVTLDPFGDHYQTLPDLLEILQECDLSKPTFYRAIAKFEQAQLFDTQPTHIAFRNLRGRRIVSNLKPESQKRDDSLKNETPISNLRNPSQKRDRPMPEPCQGNGFKKGPVPITDQTCSNQTTGTAHTGMNSEGIGTDDPLIQLIATAGIRPNKTIQRTLAKLRRERDPTEVRPIVENAISSYHEQRDRNGVPNPGGFIVSALRRGFTANYAKAQRPQAQGFTPVRLSAHVEARPPSPEPDLIQISLAIDQALLNHDRPFAINKLKTLSPHAQHELLTLRPDWQIHSTDLHQEHP